MEMLVGGAVAAEGGHVLTDTWILSRVSTMGGPEQGTYSEECKNQKVGMGMEFWRSKISTRHLDWFSVIGVGAGGWSARPEGLGEEVGFYWKPCQGVTRMFRAWEGYSPGPIVGKPFGHLSEERMAEAWAEASSSGGSRQWWVSSEGRASCLVSGTIWDALQRQKGNFVTAQPGRHPLNQGIYINTILMKSRPSLQ